MEPSNNNYCYQAYNCCRASCEMAYSIISAPFRCLYSIVSTIFSSICSCCGSKEYEVVIATPQGDFTYERFINNPALSIPGAANEKRRETIAQFIRTTQKLKDMRFQVYYNTQANALLVRLYDEASLPTVEKMVRDGQWAHSEFLNLSEGQRKMAPGGYIAMVRFTDPHKPSRS